MSSPGGGILAESPVNMTADHVGHRQCATGVIGTEVRDGQEHLVCVGLPKQEHPHVTPCPLTTAVAETVGRQKCP